MEEVNRGEEYDLPPFQNEDEEQEELQEELLLADLTGTDGADLFFEGLVDRDTGMGRVLEKLMENGRSGHDVTGGDLDDDWYQAEVVGEEAIGGQNPTPDQNVSEALMASMGITCREGEPVHTKDTFDGRDRRRWELDPSSAEDYEERRE